MKYCQGCGAPSEDNAKFCGHCGRKLIEDEKPVEVAPIEEIKEESAPEQDVDSNGKINRIPHWTQKMFAIMGLFAAIFAGPTGLAIGIIAKCLTNDNCEYKRRYNLIIIIGSISTALVILYDIRHFISIF